MMIVADQYAGRMMKHSQSGGGDIGALRSGARLAPGPAPTAWPATQKVRQGRTAGLAPSRIPADSSATPAAPHAQQRPSHVPIALEQGSRVDVGDVTSPAHGSSHSASSPSQASLDQQRAEPTGGIPLGGETQKSLSDRFSFDFSAVRIHADAAAASSAEGLRAKAFTTGSHIYFASGRYSPQTVAGRALLTHELTHVVQQSRAVPTSRPQILPTSDSSEHDADLGRVSAYLPHHVIQRQGDAGVAKPRFSPDAFSSYGAWIAALPAGAVDETSVDVSDQVKRELPDLADLVKSLRADCADVAILLRHYYLAAHGRQEVLKSYNSNDPKKPLEFPIGHGITRSQLRSAVVNLGTVNFQETLPRLGAFIKYYGGRSPVKNLKQIIEAGLKPGDVLVWQRLPGIEGNFHGHVQTIQKIVTNVDDPASPRLEVIQGTMEAGAALGEVQSKVLSFELLTGKKDGDAVISYQPESEEGFFGAGQW